MFAVDGDLDHQSSPLLAAALRSAVPATRLCIDMTECPYVDSGGLSVIFDTLSQVTQTGGWLGVIGPNPRVKRLLGLVGLLDNEHFRVFESEEQLQETVMLQSAGSGVYPS